MIETKSRILSKRNKLLRLLWGVVWAVFYRPSPVLMHRWRCFLLRVFGANIEKGALPYPSTKIWAPWNLTMKVGSCLSHHVDCYCVDKIILEANSIVSQYSFLCTASHDYGAISTPLPLVTAPIVIHANAWVTADVFVAPGVNIGEGAIVGARSTVLHDVTPWSIFAGNPAKYIKPRDIKEERNQ